MSRQLAILRRTAAIGLIVLLAVGVAFLLPGCGNGSADDGWPKDTHGPKVVVSFPPLYCFAANVAGDDATVRDMLTTSGPHNFNPTDREARLLKRADILFVNGLGLEGDKPEAMKHGSGNQNLKLIELGDRIPKNMLSLWAGEAEDGDDNKDHGNAQSYDPHIWLSPDYAVLLVEGIRDELKVADPSHSANYDRRATEYIAKLRKLKDDGIALLKDKKDRRFVTFHDSMSYFAKTFNLQIVGVVEKTPGSEPTDTQLKELINLCANPAAPVRIVCTEPQYSTSNAGQELIKILAHKNVPDPVLVEVDPMETVLPDQLAPDWYEKKMRSNLEALARAMK